VPHKAIQGYAPDAALLFSSLNLNIKLHRRFSFLVTVFMSCAFCVSQIRVMSWTVQWAVTWCYWMGF